MGRGTKGVEEEKQKDVVRSDLSKTDEKFRCSSGLYFYIYSNRKHAFGTLTSLR